MKISFRSPVLLGLLAFTVFGAAKCKFFKPSELNFGMQASELTFYTGPFAETGDHELGANKYEWNIDSVLEANNAGDYKLTSIKMDKVEADIFEPAGMTFDALENFAVYVKTSTLPEIKVAYKDPIPDGTTVLSLDLSGDELAPYVNSPDFSILLKANTSAPIEQEIGLHVRAHYQLKVELE